MLTLALLLQDGPDPSQIQHLIMAMAAVIPIIVLIVMAIVLLPLWFICKKAGFSPWLSLLIFVPLGGLILLYVLAFADWKVVPVQQIAWQPPIPPPPAPPAFPPQA
jgi:hypothetical protein